MSSNYSAELHDNQQRIVLQNFISYGTLHVSKISEISKITKLSRVLKFLLQLFRNVGVQVRPYCVFRQMASQSLPCLSCASKTFDEQCGNFSPSFSNADVCTCGHLRHRHAPGILLFPIHCCPRICSTLFRAPFFPIRFSSF